MPSLAKIAKMAILLGSVASVSALPSNMKPRKVHQARQAATTTTVAAAAATSASSGITDLDILQFALTLEHLEATFYSQGFAKFQDSDFAGAGLSTQQIADLKATGQTEATHVTVLSSVIQSLGATPVQQCTYNFNFTDPATMVATARVLEAVGVSAYIGAAPLVKSAAILTSAAEIVTVEARHQTFIRTISNAAAVPNAFDSALGPRAVFTLAAPFIASCPTGSSLAIQSFPAISLAGGGNINAGQELVLANPSQPTGAQFCAFVSTGGTTYAQFNAGACTVPGQLTGETWLLVTKSMSTNDTEILAGPTVIEFS